MSHTPVSRPAGTSGENVARGVAYHIVRATLVVIFFWVFWKFGGFLLNALVGRLYRADVESDAYFFAAQAVVYGLIFSRSLQILIPPFTPIFIEEKNKRGDRAAWEFASTVFNLVLMGCAVMMLVVYLYAQPITETLVPGFGPEAQALAIRLLRWIMPGAALMVLYLPMRSVLNSYKVFSYPCAAEATQKLAWAVGLYVTYRYLHLGILAVAVGFLVGSVGMIGVTLFGLRRRAGLYRPALPSLSGGRFWKEAAICAAFLVSTTVGLKLMGRLLPGDFAYRDILKLTLALLAVTAFTAQLWLRARHKAGVMARFAALAAPLIVSTVFAAYRDLTTFYFQSLTVRGVFSDIEYARRIALLPTTMVAYALGVAMFPYLCELAGKKDHAVLADVVTKAIYMLALGFVPLTVMTIILRDPVSRLVLDRGDWAAVHLHYTALALALLAGGLLMYAWEYVIMQSYFSLQRMWTPALMGIAATFFQFAFLVVPIYGMGLDYPVQIFFLTALAYPVSRVFKNLILLGLLRRRVPVLPARRSLAFAARLAVLTAAVGAATWVAHAQLQRRLPFEHYRQHKVVVDNFETGPETWFSLNAKVIGIVEAPGEGHGLAVMMQYNRRRRRTRCSLYREMRGIKTDGDLRLEFSLSSPGKMSGVAVEIERDGKLERIFEQEFDEAAWGGAWQELSCELRGEGRLDRIHWLELEPWGPPGEHRMYLDEVRLVNDETGQVMWSEDFDTNGWAHAEGGAQETPRARNAATEGESERYALCISRGVGMIEKDLRGFDLSGTELFRCRLLNRGSESSHPVVTLLAANQGGRKVVELPPGQWQTVEISWKDIGLDSKDRFRSVETVTLEEVDVGPVYLDDVTFRRPPSGMYELMKLLHCAIPALAGLAAAAVCLLVLRFEEMRDVVQWVKRRGWRRRGEGAEEAAGEPVES